MPKIYLSPAYHKWNPCSIEGCDETTHNNLYLDELEVYLKACGIEYKRGPRRTPKSDEDGKEYMLGAVRESNAYNADIHYVSHTNAYNGTVRGYRPMIYPGSQKAQELARIIIEKRKEIYNQPVTLNTRTDLYELRATTAPAYYEEHIFHDNKEDANWFHSNLRSIAEQTCKAFCEYFGIEFVNPYEIKEEESLYRVRKSWEDSSSQTGAFLVLQNAIENAQENKLNVYDNKGQLVFEYIEPEKEVYVEQPEITEEEHTEGISVILKFIDKIIDILKKLFHKE